MNALREFEMYWAYRWNAPEIFKNRTNSSHEGTSKVSCNLSLQLVANQFEFVKIVGGNKM